MKTITDVGGKRRFIGRWIACWVAALALWASHPAVLAQTQTTGGKQRRSRVVLVSFDGLAYHIWTRDPVARQLRSLTRTVTRGVAARGLIQAFPSVTPNGHAAIWTGAYGDVSGINAASNPVLPRAEHTVIERGDGFSADSLLAEPLWVAAARQGVRVVAHQATQNYPFNSKVTAPGASTAPVLVSGYGPEELAKEAVIRPADVSEEDASGWSPPLPRSSLPVRAFKWTAGSAVFHGALIAERYRAQGYTALYVASDRTGARVRVAPHPTESVPPGRRELARHFSEGLRLVVGDRAVPTVAYFRLFALSPDGKDFLIYQPSIHELALYDGSAGSQASREQMLREAGGFIANGPSYLYIDGLLGRQLFKGGNGTAERRYLEGMELVIRQHNRLSEWLCARYDPQLLIDYSNYPDEMEHTWYGLARPDVTGAAPRIVRLVNQYRRWAYAAIDVRMDLMDRLTGDAGHLVIVSDHGMSPILKEVNVRNALRAAGLTVVNNEGEVDLARTRAVYLKYSILINTEDWLKGIVKSSDRRAVVEKVEWALRDVRDPETKSQVFTAFFRPELHGKELGIGGPAGGDLYFELAPGYEAVDGKWAGVIRRAKVPSGEHGFLPKRPEMLASFVARGPRLPVGQQIPTIKSIDVASIIAELLGIQPPAQNQGVLPAQLSGISRQNRASRLPVNHRSHRAILQNSER